MDYLALYRRMRPRKFSEVIGQESVVTALRNAVRENKLAHAYLFSGPRGTGKTSIAKILAKAVNCPQQKDGEPCDTCSNCEDINSGSFMDVLEIDAASNRGINEIRDLKEKVRVLPAQGRKKVYIIDEVHMLTNEAFNALLKTLEEPPESVMFILATTEPYKVPATVLSRCQRYSFVRFTVKEIEDRLFQVAQEINTVLEPKAAVLIAQRANGSMRDALSILEQCMAYGGNELDVIKVRQVLGLADEETMRSLAFAILAGKTEDILAAVDDAFSQGIDSVQMVRELAYVMRDLMVFQVFGSRAEPMAMAGQDLKNIQGFKVSPKKLSRAVRYILRLADELRISEGQRFILEAAFLELSELLAEEEKVPTYEKESPRPEFIMAKDEVPKEKRATGHVPEWADILEAVKSKRVTTQALLALAKHSYYEGETFIVGYTSQYRLIKEKMEDKANLEILQKTLQERFGKKVEVKVILMEESQKSPSVVSKAYQLFGKDKVEVLE